MKNIMALINNENYLKLTEITKYINDNSHIIRRANKARYNVTDGVVKNLFFSKDMEMTISKQEVESMGLTDVEMDIKITDESTMFGIPFDYDSPTALKDVKLYLNHIKVLNKVYTKYRFKGARVSHIIDEVSSYIDDKKSGYKAILNSLVILEMDKSDFHTFVKREDLLSKIKELFLPTKMYTNNVSYLTTVQMGLVHTHNLEAYKELNNTVNRDVWSKLIKTQLGRDLLGELWVLRDLNSVKEFSKDIKEHLDKYKKVMKTHVTDMKRLRKLRDIQVKVNDGMELTRVEKEMVDATIDFYRIEVINGEIASIKRDMRKRASDDKPKKLRNNVKPYTKVISVSVSTDTKLGGYSSISPSLFTKGMFSFHTSAVLLSGKYGSGLWYQVPYIYLHTL